MGHRGSFAQRALIYAGAFLTYFLAGHFALRLAYVNVCVSPVWPTSGIALAALLLWGPHLWPAIFLGAFLINFMAAGNVSAAALIGLGNTLEALAGWYTVNRWAEGRRFFEHPLNIAKFVLAAGLFCPLISATIGIAALYWNGMTISGLEKTIWFTWWMGDSGGALIVTPCLILLFTRPGHGWRNVNTVPVLLTLGVALALGQSVFGGWTYFLQDSYPLTFLFIPLVVWTAFRFSSREVAVVSTLVAAMAAWGTLHGVGPFVQLEPNTALLLLQFFTGTIMVTGLIVASLLSERQRITDELSANEERLRLFFEHAPAAMAMMDNNMRYVAVSPRWIEGFHLNCKESDLIGRSHYDVFPDIPEKWKTVHQKVLKGSVEKAEEDSFPRADGTMEWVRWEAHPWYLPNHRVGGLIIFTDVITERKRAEEERLREKQQESERLERLVEERTSELRQKEEELLQTRKMESIGRLAGGVAHDFNNLLTGIIGCSDTLEAEISSDDERRTDVLEIKRAAQRAAGLTKQLLAFGRKQIMAPVVLNLNNVVNETSKLLRRLIGEDIRLEIELDPSLGMVKADPAQLEQVILNLGANARDAMPGGGTLSLRTSNAHFTDEMPAPGLSQGGDYVMLSITDTGEGMPKDVQSHLFEPFYTTKQRGKGTGLGLATVYGIIQQLGGHISVYSQVGYGSSFKIFLPIVTDSERHAPNDGGVSQAAPGGSESILLVEDEEVVANHLVRLLKRKGYHVFVARDGLEALDVLKKAPRAVDMVLTDVIMPRMNGRQLIKNIQQDHPKIRVLYMSGYPEEVVGKAGALDPGIAFIEKPFYSEQLLTKIRDVLS